MSFARGRACALNTTAGLCDLDSLDVPMNPTLPQIVTPNPQTLNPEP